MTRHMMGRVARSVLVAWTGVLAIACGEPTQNGAPDDAKVAVRFDADTLVMGDSTPVYGLLHLATGDPAHSGWEISLEVSTGVLSVSKGPVATLKTDTEGQVTTYYKAGTSAGLAIVTAVSRDARAADSIVVVKSKTSAESASAMVADRHIPQAHGEHVIRARGRP